MGVVVRETYKRGTSRVERTGMRETYEERGREVERAGIRTNVAIFVVYFIILTFTLKCPRNLKNKTKPRQRRIFN